jgi:hypothetical protein
VVISLNSVNQLVFIMVESCGFFAVRTTFKYYLEELRLPRVKLLICEVVKL